MLTRDGQREERLRDARVWQETLEAVGLAQPPKQTNYPKNRKGTGQPRVFKTGPRAVSQS